MDTASCKYKFELLASVQTDPGLLLLFLPSSPPAADERLFATRACVEELARLGDESKHAANFAEQLIVDGEVNPPLHRMSSLAPCL